MNLDDIDFKNRLKSGEYYNSLDWEAIDTPRDWFENDIALTHGINSLGLIIPEAEKFVLKIINSYRSRINSPKLLGEIDRFIKEEQSHSLQHTRFNQEVKRNGYDIKKPLKVIRFIYTMTNAFFSEKTRLAMALGLEHNTIVFARYALKKHLLKENDSEVYGLFMWHCYEELSHGTFLNDVYKDVGGGYCRRALSMLYISIVTLVMHIYIIPRFVKTDVKENRSSMYKTRYSLLKFIFRKNGLMRLTYKDYFSIFKLDYNP